MLKDTVAVVLATQHEEITLDAFLEQYTTKLNLLIGIKAATRHAYLYGSKDFLKWCFGEKQSPVVEPEKTLLRYRDALDAREISASTKRSYLHAAKRIYKQLYFEGTLERDFSTRVRTFAVATKERRYLTDKDVQRCFSFINTQNDKRLTLIFTLMYYQGLRQKEIMTARIGDYDSKERTLHVLGKARDEREPVHLHPATVRVIEWFIAHPATQKVLTVSPNDYFLYSRKRGTGHITSQRLHALIRGVHDKCDVHSTPHAWRASFISEMIRSKQFTMPQLQKFSRHKNLGTLQRYYDNADFMQSLPRFYQALDEQLVKTM